MDWCHWRHRASHAMMKALVTGLEEHSDEQKVCRVAQRCLVHLAHVVDLLEPLARKELSDLPYVVHFRRVVDMVADWLEHAISEAMAGKKQLLPSLQALFQMKGYNVLDKYSSDRSNLSLKDAPTLDQFATLVIGRMDGPVELGKVMAGFVAIDRAMSRRLENHLFVCFLASL